MKTTRPRTPAKSADPSPVGRPLKGAEKATGRRFSIERIRIPKAADVLASHLRDEIVEGRLSNGEMLPTERELAEGAGLSRSSVREALHMLEIEGLLVTKPGRNGGSMVCQPSRDTIVKTVSLYISSRKTQLTPLIEARAALEPSGAMLAAKHRTDVDIEAIRSMHENLEASIDDLDEFLRANIDWHLAVIHASHNDLLIAFMESISGQVYAATNVERMNPLEIRQQVIRVHARITDAIIEGDPAAAKRRMERHVGAYAGHLGIE